MSIATTPDAIGNIECDAVMITPAMATEWLERNTQNREFRAGNYDKLKASVQQQGWRITPDAIALDTDNILVNGQHRLRLIVELDTPLPCLVAYNLPTGSYDATDRGRPRTLADALHQRGEQASKRLAPVIRLLYQYEQTGNMRHNSGGVTYPDTVLAAFYYDGRPDLANSVKEWRAAQILSDSPLSVIHYCASKAYGREDANEFMRGLLKGIGLNEDDPRYAARERLLRARRTDTATNPRLFALTNVEQRALVIIAFNKWINGETITPSKLIWRAGGANPQPFPLIQNYPYFKTPKNRPRRPRRPRRPLIPPDR